MSEKSKSEVYLPTDELKPAWYSVEVADGCRALFISIHETAFQYLCSLSWEKRRDVPLYKSRFELEEFIVPKDSQDFGFGGILNFRHKLSRWLTWRVPLPVLSFQEKEDVVRKQEKTIRATLLILFEDLAYFDGDTGCVQNQAMLIQGVRLGQGDGDAAISAVITPEAIPWIKAQPNEQHNQEIIEVMKTASNYMLPGARGHSGGFGALFRSPDVVHLDVPGQSTGLDPDTTRLPGDGKGYKLCPHNVDSALQQLTLLVGLVKMWSLAKEYAWQQRLKELKQYDR